MRLRARTHLPFMGCALKLLDMVWTAYISGGQAIAGSKQDCRPGNISLVLWQQYLDI
jgi:hypothetical protein